MVSMVGVGYDDEGQGYGVEDKKEKGLVRGVDMVYNEWYDLLRFTGVVVF